MNELHKNKGIELPDTLWQFVWRYLKTRKIYIAGMALAGIVWCIQMAVNPYFLKKIIDGALLSEGNSAGLLHAVGVYCVLFVAMTAIGALFANLYMVINLKLFPKVKAEIVSDMYHYLIYHSYTFFRVILQGV